MNARVQQMFQTARAADAAAGVSVIGAASSMATANEILQAIAALVAIVAGLMAIIGHMRRK